MTLQVCLILLLSAGAVVMDLLGERIWNPWIWLGWGTGVLYQFLLQGNRGILIFLSGGLLPILLLFPLFYFRMLGAGDVKLLSALGGLLGARGILSGLAWSFLWGGILSGAFLIACGNAGERMAYLGQYLRDYMRTGEKKPYYRRGSRPENIHFTVPILLGMLMYAGGYY
ncbi:prepilin peptidase [Lactonifactor longoviformis]|uniref:prepilin peptidase n=1 Tax=Lactonifactor longoviformis TaxID=341220 RepID=UPI0036F2C7A8